MASNVGVALDVAGSFNLILGSYGIEHVHQEGAKTADQNADPKIGADLGFVKRGVW